MPMSYPLRTYISNNADGLFSMSDISDAGVLCMLFSRGSRHPYYPQISHQLQHQCRTRHLLVKQEERFETT